MSSPNARSTAPSSNMQRANRPRSSSDSAVAYGQQGQIFPVELVTLISTFLYDSRSLKTVAQLNRTSKAVRQETISVLYQTVGYKCVPSWVHTMGFTVPPGWKYTRNLLLSNTTFQLLLQHLRFMAHLKIISKPTIEEAFPKLDLIAVTDHQSFTKITLYKPLTMAAILERLKTDKFKEPSFFGTTENRKPSTAGQCRPGCRRSLEAGMETITELELKDGAYLLPATSSDVVGFHAEDPTKLLNFRLASRQLPKDPEASKECIKQVLQCFRNVQEQNTKVKDMALSIEAPAEWCDVLIEALSEIQPMHGNVHVTILTASTYAAFRQVVTSLADVYSTNWLASAVEQNLRKHFVLVHGLEQQPSPSMTLIAPASNGARLMGSLELGRWVEGENGAGAVHQERGFGANVYRLAQGLVGGLPPLPEAHFYEAYPCEAGYAAVEQAGDA
ncbi:hypothetical protein QFC20_006561 [Naganishia adeliensis]|uniref:Uncharacterized protein n=1 Tax=Naganishia adeliensis TaxID=92952 RepID=A0ACC2VBA3_9TREE|nr:hypothetical protein QFC20_006561 [Naganishia adeliensis]